MAFTAIFGVKNPPMVAHHAPEMEQKQRQGFFRRRGVKRQRASTDSSRSSATTTPPTPPPPPPISNTPAIGDGDSAIAVVFTTDSTGNSAATSPANSSVELSRDSQPRRKSSFARFYKSFFSKRRKDSHQTPACCERRDSLPLDPLDQAYLGQLPSVDAGQLLERFDGPSDFWRKSPQFKSATEPRRRRGSTWSTASSHDPKEPVTSPFSDPSELYPSDLHPSEPSPPRSRLRRLSSMSWLTAGRRPSEKSLGKRPLPRSPETPDQAWQPAPLTPPRSIPSQGTSELKVSFDSRKPSLPIAISPRSSAVLRSSVASARRESINRRPLSPYPAPKPREMSIPELDIEDLQMGVDGSRVTSSDEDIFQMSPFDSDQESESDCSDAGSVESGQASGDEE